MKKLSTTTRICCIACAILMLAVIILQFMPFLNTGDKELSVQEYIWLPQQNKDVTSFFGEQFEGANGKAFRVNGLLLPPLMILVIGALGVFFCLFMPNYVWAFLCALCTGLFCIFGYLFTPALQITKLWFVYPILGVFITACGVIMMIPFIKIVYKWFTTTGAEADR